ncbi:DUF6512 family protein [Anaerolentibacter hominis]|uniref:DUF6512 family protein n=1 Tax=Anaerolentibacter hominis TaxID=3079009 RepID=UPI0031B8642A
MEVFILNLKKWHILGALCTILLGSLVHFTYAWSGKNPVVGSLSAVNESTWEHLKLLFTPLFLFTLIDYPLYGKEFKNFLPVRFLSILLGMFVIVAAFYTYSGILGRNFLAADIATFILGVIAAYCFSCHFLKSGSFSSPEAAAAGKAGLVLLLVLFILFTFVTPRIGLFKDPVTGGYGIEANAVQHTAR